LDCTFSDITGGQVFADVNILLFYVTAKYAYGLLIYEAYYAQISFFERIDKIRGTVNFAWNYFCG